MAKGSGNGKPNHALPVSILLKHEGGYAVVLAALSHYKRRLKTIGQSPELENSAAMFASVLVQQARKTVPEIDRHAKRIHDILAEPSAPELSHDEIEFLKKALACRISDIQKARDANAGYFADLVGDMGAAVHEIPMMERVMAQMAAGCPAGTSQSTA